MDFRDTPTTEALVDEALAQGEGLGSPLRYVQLNGFCNGSTGTIMRSLHRALTERGIDSYILWGYRHETISDRECCIATKPGYLIHGALVRLDDRLGFPLQARHREASEAPGRNLLRRGAPVQRSRLLGQHRDAVRLAGGVFLSGQLSPARSLSVSGSLHVLGGLSAARHLSQDGMQVELLEELRGQEEDRLKCPARADDANRLPYWREGLVQQGILEAYSVVACHNTANKSAFKFTISDFRALYGIGDCFMILGVAIHWIERKALFESVLLAHKLDPERYSIVLVGLIKNQIK